MNCPLCSTATEDGAAECPSCGVIFEKLRERQERARKAADEATLQAETPEISAASDPKKVRIAAAAIVVAWMLGLGLYYHASLREVRGNARPASAERR